MLAFVLLLFVAADVWFFRAAKASLPMVDGTLKLPGLNAPVIVTRDSLGVPNITAGNLHDLFFAQGFVTAQDRLWQMDMTRRYASGDLSAVLGPEYTSNTDEEQRAPSGFVQVAEKAVTTMAPEERARLQAYADGVNAYILQHQKTLPLEFRLMTYFPYIEWTVEDSMLVGLSMTEFLNHYMYKKELQREKILAQLGSGADGRPVRELVVARSRSGRGGAVDRAGGPAGGKSGAEEEEDAPGKPVKSSAIPGRRQASLMPERRRSSVLRFAQNDKQLAIAYVSALADPRHLLHYVTSSTTTSAPAPTTGWYRARTP